jgi:hypothetical protein
MCSIAFTRVYFIFSIRLTFSWIYGGNFFCGGIYWCIWGWPLKTGAWGSIPNILNCVTPFRSIAVTRTYLLNPIHKPNGCSSYLFATFHFCITKYKGICVCVYIYIEREREIELYEVTFWNVVVYVRFTTFLDKILLARSSSYDFSGVAGRSKWHLWH